MLLPSGVRVEQHPTEALLGPLNEVERKHAPHTLYVAGDTGLLEVGPRVAVVGSRRPSEVAVEEARDLARMLVAHAVVVVSGLARGIDTVAHRTTLQEGGKTVAVIGTPLDTCYPRENAHLQARLMREHLVVSQFAPGAPIQRKNFPLRNRTMALLSDATVIVEAGNKSGSLHQGWEALRLGRPLFLMARLAEDPALDWPQRMLEYGAVKIHPHTLDMILEVLPAPGHRAQERAPF